MNLRNTNPIRYFNEWFAEPIVVIDKSVIGVIEALNKHPLASDLTAQDYVMPIEQCCEQAGRFRIYGENQDGYYCFVYKGDESKIDPPVYFESSLDLNIDHGIDPSHIINNDHVLCANHFTEFLWQMLGHHICVRSERPDHFSDNVTGIIFHEDINLDDSFINPLGREFPAGFTCFFSDDVICIPDWGAAFLNAQSRHSFMARYSLNVSAQWP